MESISESIQMFYNSYSLKEVKSKLISKELFIGILK